MPWTAIVNPVAGRGRTRKLLPDLERAADAAGIELHISPEPGAPTKLAVAATDARHDLVAVGGDGLVTEVAGVAADAGCRLAIVPTGAGNDFARVLGYEPKQPLRAFDALARGTDRLVDLGRVNGRWYTCVTASG
ncbi:MAG TPA: diacylglycerol kinase family protein, partial [Acidimicrobiia bacterium]|nr:diacylglycerol kinase family protein [Acidimicrobiia bacterium]